MSAPIDFPATRDAFARILSDIKTRCDLDARLPAWPFLAPFSGFVTIYEYDRILGTDFGETLEALAAEHRDDVITVVGITPSPSYYQKAYDYSPGFQVGRGDLPDGYGDRIRYEPQEDPTGALADTINVIAMVGDSGAWSLWGERYWEIALLLTTRPKGPWLDATVPSFDRDIDLDTLQYAPGWRGPRKRMDRRIFRRNIRKRGSGRDS